LRNAFLSIKLLERNMAENDTSKPRTDSPESKSAEASQDAQQSPDIGCAAEAVRRAEAELKKARELYEKARGKAVEQLKAVREKKMGELIDGTLTLVKKHPGPGVLVAMIVGYFLGRLFKK
jgi:hypothetical protein